MPEKLAARLAALKTRLLFSSGLLAAAIMAGGWYYYSGYLRTVEKERTALLSSVSDFKLSEIEEWRAERLRDAESLLDSPIFGRYVGTLYRSPSDAENAGLVKARLLSFIKHNNYLAASMVYPDGRVALTAGAAPTPRSAAAEIIKAVTHSGQASLGDLYMNAGKPALSAGAPALLRGGRPALILLLEADPEAYLYPLLKKWPTNSPTAETLLVRREGNAVLFLNELRHKRDTAMRLKLPADSPLLPAAMGVRGTQGAIQGRDYRGEKVLAVIRQVPGTGWVLITKMDWHEVLAGTATDAALVLLLMSALAAAGAAGVFIIFRLQTEAYARAYGELDKYTAKLRLNYQHLSDQANDAIFLTDAATLRIVEANRKSAEIYGYPKEKLAGMSLEELVPPDTLRDQMQRLEYAKTHPGAITEGLHMRAGGESFPAEISSAFVSIDGKEHIYSIVRDISARKKAEHALRESEEHYRLLFEAESDAILVLDSATGEILQANGAAERMYGYSRSELIGMSNTQTSAEPEVTGKFTTGKPAGPDDVIYVPHRLHKRKDGTVFPVEITGRSFASGGRLLRIVAIRDITEREKAEEARRENERRIATLMSNLPGMAYRCRNDREWTMEFISDACGRITGYAPEDFIGNRTLSFTDITLPEYRENAWNITQEALAARRGFQLFYRIRRKDGALRDVMEQGSGVWDANGGLVALEGYIADVTEQKELETALHRNRDLVDAAGEMAHVGGWELDVATGTVTWSQETYRIHEADQSFKPDPRSIYRFYPGDTGDALHREIEAAVNSGKAFDIQMPILTAAGRRREVRTIGRPVTENGRTIKVWGAIQDITKQNLAERALRTRIVALTQPLDSADIVFEDMFDLEELQRLQDAFSAATGVASLITRPDGTPITRPSNFCRLCNDIIRRTEKGSRNCALSDTTIGRHKADGPVMQRCLSGGLWDGGASITVGGRHVASWLMGQVKNQDCDEKEILAYAREIGADEAEFARELAKVPSMSKEQFAKICDALFLMAQQLSLKAYQNILQARVITARIEAEKKAELLNAELLAKNQEMESYLYISSHDLRSPLVNIQGFAESIAKYCAELGRLLPQEKGRPKVLLEEKLPEAVSFVTSSSAKMDSLINGLLKISRLGRVEMRPEPLDMEKLAAEVVKTATFQLREAGAEVCLGLLPPCRGDRAQLSQVFSNFVDNALKYRDKSRQLRIEISGRDTGRGTVEYTVSDNGKGLTEEQAAKVWQLFYRADPRGEVKGDGLGLTIVKRIVDRHGGRINAAPGRNGGAVFTLELPKSQEVEK